MKTSVKRFFSLICAICMMISNVPVNVLAEMIVPDDSSSWSENTSEIIETVVPDISEQAEDQADAISVPEDSTNFVEMQVGKSKKISLNKVVLLTVKSSGLIYVAVDSDIQLTNYPGTRIDRFPASDGRLVTELSVDPGVYELSFASADGKDDLFTVDIMDEKLFLARQSGAPEETGNAEQTDAKSDEGTIISSEDRAQEEFDTEEAESAVTASTDYEEVEVVETEVSEEDTAEVLAESETTPVVESAIETEAPVISENEVNIDAAETSEAFAMDHEANPETEEAQAISDVENLSEPIDTGVNEESPVVEDTQEESAQSGEETAQTVENSELASKSIALTDEITSDANTVTVPSDENEEVLPNETILIVVSPEGTDETRDERIDITNLPDVTDNESPADEEQANEHDAASIFDEIGGVEGTTDTQTDEAEETVDPQLINVSDALIDTEELELQTKDENTEEAVVETEAEEKEETEIDPKDAKKVSEVIDDSAHEDKAGNEIAEAGETSVQTEDEEESFEDDVVVEENEAEENEVALLSSDDIYVEQLSEDKAYELVQRLGVEEQNKAMASARGLRRMNAKTSVTTTEKSGYVALNIDLINDELSDAGKYVVPVTLSVPVYLAEDSESIAIKAIDLYHFTEEGIQKEAVIEYTIEDGNLTSFVFETNGFSTYVLKYTVDFRYNDYAWSMTGGGSVSLQELFATLGIEDNANEAASVVFSDPDLLSIDNRNGEWALVSLKPFDTLEMLKVTMLDGTVYLVSVSDDQERSSIAINDIASMSLSTVSSTTDLARSGANLAVQIKFDVDDDVDIRGIMDNHQLNWIYDLTNLVKDDQYFVDHIEYAAGDIYDDGEYVGKWTMTEEGMLTFEVDETYLSTHQKNISGYFNLSLYFNEIELGRAWKTTLEFPDAGEVPVTFRRPFSLEKSIDENAEGDIEDRSNFGNNVVYFGEEGPDIDMENYRIPYQIEIKSNMTDLDLSQVIISDSISGGAKFVEDSFTVTIGEQIYTYEDFYSYLTFGSTLEREKEEEKEFFEIDFGTWAEDKVLDIGSNDIIINYVTKYDAVENLLNTDKESTEFVNSVNYTIDGVSPDSQKSTTTTLKYIPEPRYVSKSSKSNNAELHYQTEYTYTMTFGGGYTDHNKAVNMAGQKIADTMSGYSKLISDIIVTDSEGNPYVVYSEENENAIDEDFVFLSGFDLKNHDVGKDKATLFTMTFEDGFDDQYTGPFTVTYTMKVDPPAGFAGKLEVTNEIDETGNLGDADASVKNEALVGILTIGKDVRNYNEDGTVTWAIPITVEEGWPLFVVSLKEYADEFCYYYTIAEDGFSEKKRVSLRSCGIGRSLQNWMGPKLRDMRQRLRITVSISNNWTNRLSSI